MIRLVLEGLPPSSNNAYFNLPKGGRSLTNEGRAWKRETTAFLAQKYPKDMMFFKPNVPYAMYFFFHCDNVENETWGKPKGAKTRYKKFDGGNRTKLLEDVLKDAGGIDDSQTLVSLWQKLPSLSGEKTVIVAYNLEEEATPFDELLRAVRQV